ncbi:MerC domain-containing protein [Aliikangiella marina]|uniref:MerC domain-containing protein n=1 Tax=Aliikangiella marina TaxID=1712262 RepID=A0A545T4E8_9GAMM|nr:MerC domain-containing protein [Aliikangiella marina]TQV72104.1 MerC domain-containing protein [Aliikangiella marina]
MNIAHFLQPIGDKTAIGLSFLCVVHCLILPLLLILVPSSTLQMFSDEGFHQGILIAVFISSFTALTIGFKKHKQISIVYWISAGLMILFSAALLGHDLLGEYAEKILTVLGAAIIAIGHIKNYKTCCHSDRLAQRDSQ